MEIGSVIDKQHPKIEQMLMPMFLVDFVIVYSMSACDVLQMEIQLESTHVR